MKTTKDVVDVVLMWWREEDGDLVDALVDALTPLADGGYIWLLTPKAGRPGHVEPSDIGEAAPTAGLAQTSSVRRQGLVGFAAGRAQGAPVTAPRARAPPIKSAPASAVERTVAAVAASVAHLGVAQRGVPRGSNPGSRGFRHGS